MSKRKGKKGKRGKKSKKESFETNISEKNFQAFTNLSKFCPSTSSLKSSFHFFSKSARKESSGITHHDLFFTMKEMKDGKKFPTHYETDKMLLYVLNREKKIKMEVEPTEDGECKKEDTTLKYPDFEKFMMKLVEDSNSYEDSQQIFNIFSRGHAFVSAEGLKEVMSVYGEDSSLEGIQKMIAQYDIDLNEKLSYDEFMGLFMDAFL